MNIVIVVLSVTAFVSAIVFSNAQQLSNAAISGSAEAFALIIKLAGGICFWSGLMNVMEKSGISNIFNKLLRFPVKLIFGDIDINSKAAQLICMNITCNLLGLGNAATPIGIKAMTELNKLNKNKNTASSSMINLAVINSSSLQLLPTNLMIMRSALGSKNPLDILPAVICCSFLSVFAGIFTAKTISHIKGRKR